MPRRSAYPHADRADAEELETGRDPDCRNGLEALEVIRSQRPELVFLDVMMPKMDGFDECQAVKNDPDTSRTRVILLTAKGQEFDRQRGEQAGADLYLTKPFNPDELLEVAREALES
jgi:CheY-like chemotaxis protein